MMRRFMVLVCLAALTAQCGEVEEVRRLAKLPRWQGAALEVRLWDGTRVDMVTEEYAIEVDWAKGQKWAEGPGQAIYYAETLGKKPGVILLVRDARKEARFVYRCAVVCAKAGVRLWVEVIEEEKMTNDELPKDAGEGR